MTPSTSRSNTGKIVTAAVTRLFVDQDAADIDEYVASSYTGHALASAEPGSDSLRHFVADLPPGFRFEVIRVLAQDDHAVTHGIYYGFSPDSHIAVDIWRVADEKNIEHWDAIAPRVVTTLSGRSQTDGPTEVANPGLTETARKIVTEFLEQVLIARQYKHLGNYVSSSNFRQHSPEIADGLEAFIAAIHPWAS